MRDIRTRALAAIVAACSIAIITAACSGGATPTPQATGPVGATPTPQATGPVGATPTPQASLGAYVCTSLTAFGKQIDEVKALDPATATADDVAARRDQVATAWAEIGYRDVLEGANVATALKAAYVGLETALKDVPTDVPIATTVTAIKAAATPIGVAVDEMESRLKCKVTSPAPSAS